MANIAQIGVLLSAISIGCALLYFPALSFYEFLTGRHLKHTEALKKLGYFLLILANVPLGLILMGWIEPPRLLAAEPVLVQNGIPTVNMESELHPGGVLRLDWVLNKLRECTGLGAAFAIGVNNSDRYQLNVFNTHIERDDKAVKPTFPYPLHANMRPGKYVFESQIEWKACKDGKPAPLLERYYGPVFEITTD